MDKVRTKQIGEIKGTGRILREGEVAAAKAPYSLRVRQDVITTQTFGERSSVRGNREITGRIRLDEMTIAPLLGEELILELDDGRRLPFAFRDGRGSIQALRWFKQEGEEGPGEKHVELSVAYYRALNIKYREAGINEFGN